MQTTYRLKAQEISMAFLKTLRTLFAGQEVEITVRSVESEKKGAETDRNALFAMIKDNRNKAPIISPEIDIRGLIDETQNPG
ncbi:MAG: hypothetical protein ACXVAY_11370 [Mucilaginibacter sp.]